ncbi:AmmeMemoRadiSam system protein A [Puteibacter caeruleilacunae]|nr:AmmeMemoRadiSam system protein A [Puteibacter caeruleilacunae]
MHKLLKKEFSILTLEDKASVLRLARKVLEDAFSLGDYEGVLSLDEEERLRNLYFGIFVSIYKGKKLKGCIGTLREDLSLYELVVRMTRSAALHDSRFENLKPKDIPKTRIELSILTPLQAIDDISEIEIGRHGIYMTGLGRSGVFLPQVATNNNWSVEEMLGYCARNKAGLDWESWNELDLYIFEAIILSE